MLLFFRNDYDLKTISGDKVIIDHATGLMWHQSGSEGFMNWDKAKNGIRSLDSRGYAGKKMGSDLECGVCLTNKEIE